VSPDELFVFRAAAKTLNFSKVEVAGLHLSQPAVSIAIHKLEEKLGRPLFERQGRTKRLTAAGAALAEIAGEFLESWEHLPARLEATLTAAVRGTVRVGAGEGAILYLLPGAIERFRRRHPDVDIVIRNQPIRETLAQLRSNEIDFGVRSPSTTPAWAEFRRWRTFDRVLITRKPSPLVAAPTLEDVARHPLVLPWRDSTSRQVIEQALTKAGLEYRIALEAGGWEIIKRYVELGLGVAVVPSYCLQQADRKRLALRPAARLFGQDVYGIITKRDRGLSPAARALLQAIDPRG
jgi:DNA-binding transcriptional LysR family regulator